MNWQEVCANPALQNLPYKMELNQQGQIIMSPASVLHVIFPQQDPCRNDSQEKLIFRARG